MIGFAEEKMLPKLYAIWQECFEDDKQYIDSFFQCFDVTSTVMVYTNEVLEPVSMLSVLPAFFECNGTRKKAAYLYGVATSQKYRGKGYASRLLQAAVEKLEAEHTIAFLSPATKELYSFYEKNGLVLISNKEVWKMSRYEKEYAEISWGNVQCEDIGTAEYESLRNTAFSKGNFLRWPIEVLEYAKRENAYFGGCMQKLSYDGKEYGVLYRIEGQKLDILEITETDEKKVHEVAMVFLNSMKHVQSVQVRRSMDAMANWKDTKETILMNLTMG